MFKPILGAVLAHKHLVIAAIAVSGLVVYAFPYNVVEADHLPISIDETIEVACEPYCAIVEDALQPIDQTFGDLVHVQISYTFV
jgi:hypothetical protein